MVEIAVAAQDKFGVEIPDDQLKDLKTVQDVVNFVSKSCREHRVSRRARDRRRHRARRDHPARRGRRVDLGGACWPDAAAYGRSTEPWAAELPVRIAAQAAVDPVEVVGRVQAPPDGPLRAVRLVAAREAWADAGTAGGRPGAARRRGRPAASAASAPR